MRLRPAVLLTPWIAVGLASCASPVSVPDSLYDCTCSCSTCDTADPATGACTSPHAVRFGAMACAPEGDLSGAAGACSAACSSFPSDSRCSLESAPALRQARACLADTGPRVVAVHSPLAIAAAVDPAETLVVVTLADGTALLPAVAGDLTLEGGNCPGASCPVALTSLELALPPGSSGPHTHSDFHLLSGGRLTGTIDPSGTFVFDAQTTSLVGWAVLDGQYNSAQGRPQAAVAGWMDTPGGLIVLPVPYVSPQGDAITTRLVARITHRPPVAAAGPVQQVGCGTPVRLDSAGSRAPDGAVAGFAWYTGFGGPDQSRIATGAVAEVTLPPGIHPITLLLRDDRDGLATAATTVTVEDPGPPQIACPASTLLECDGGGAALGGPPAATRGCGDAVVACSPAPGSFFAAGGTGIETCTATDSLGRSASCAFPVTVADTLPPAVTARGGEGGFAARLWPPDGKLHPFSLSDCIASATDRCDGALDPQSSATILRITSDERDTVCDGHGHARGHWPVFGLRRFDRRHRHGHACFDRCHDEAGDMLVTGDATALLRAERNGFGDGRVYTIHFEIRDRQGNATQGSCRVGVPQGHRGAPVDSGIQSCVGSGCP